MPIRLPFNAKHHEQYMNARNYLGMALESLRRAKASCATFTDQRGHILASMFTRSLEHILQRAQALQSGAADEQSLMNGTKTKTERLVIVIESAQQFSLDGLFEPGKDERVFFFKKCIQEAHEYLLNVGTILADTVR